MQVGVKHVCTLYTGLCTSQQAKVGDGKQGTGKQASKPASKADKQT